ncbi:YbaB/EbfC family nucleoid-associated protein [Nocardia sp. NBC_01009]|uniref:YbaB/EbfC family nucleoid-associated protein n=1 Tax=Nocardia sp. NBC_01009 TaxID=2975996 RepID=UPI00386E796D|nr:YbaB/EbfC family nucleoid-associated protein [Nocardia sp. NBC_01009]
MDEWTHDGLRSVNNGLRNQVNDILDAYEQHQARVVEAYRQLETIRVQATSPDQLVVVTVDAQGVLSDVQLTMAAMRTTPEQLGRSITEATQAAARAAQERAEALIAETSAAADDMPDLPDIVPDAPSLSDIRAAFREAGETRAGD